MDLSDIRDLVVTTRKNELELPTEVAVSYSSKENDYQVGTQYARRLTVDFENKIEINLPLVLTSQEAAKIADIILKSSWHNARYLYKFTTTYKYAKLSVGDVVTIPLNTGKTEKVKIISMEFGPTGLINIEAIPDNVVLYESYATGANSANVSQSVSGLPGPTNLNLLDCTLLRDTDDDIISYVSMSGYVESWSGGVLYKSSDSGATYSNSLSTLASNAATVGIVNNTLAWGDPKGWDKSSYLEVQLLNGETLSSSTELNVLNGANAALVGTHGRWELLQFTNAVLNIDGTYTLTDLLRGRRGTEHAISYHAQYDTFILLNNTSIQKLICPISELNSSRLYKAVTSGEYLEDTPSTSYIWTGESKKPLSPSNVCGGRDASNNITIRFTRRERVNAGWNNNIEVSTSEGTNNFNIEIYSDSGYTILKRTKTITALANNAEGIVSYTATEQTTDGITPGSTIYVSIYQISATVGNGRYTRTAI